MKPADDHAQAPKYYGLAAIRRSFGHFVLGKGLSAVSSLIVLVVIIRSLAVGEFAVYASLSALVLMLGLLSSPGVKAVLLRFLPELRAAHNNRAMYRLLAIGLALRMVFYLIAALVVLSIAGLLSSWLKMGEWEWLLPLYLVVGFFRITATFTSSALESLLWQREAQYSLAIAFLVKLAAVLAAVWMGTLSLKLLVWIECGVELLSLVLMLMAALVRWLTDPARSTGDAAVLVQDWRRYTKFGLWTYAQNLTSILYGSAPNRLLIGFFLPVSSIALFGAVDRLITYVRRYEPLLIFLGMVRPIFNSRFTRPSDFPRLVSMANLLFRVNLIVLLMPFILFAVAGKPLFDWLTAGKYVEAAPLFLAFYTVVILSSANPMIDVLVKVVEQNRIYTASNLLMSASTGLAIPLLPYMGLWALALANLTGIVLAISLIFVYLKRVGYPILIDWNPIIRLVGATAAAVGAGQFLLRMGVTTPVSVVLSYVAFAVTSYFLPALSGNDKALISQVMRRGNRATSKMSIGSGSGNTEARYANE